VGARAENRSVLPLYVHCSEDRPRAREDLPARRGRDRALTITVDIHLLRLRRLMTVLELVSVMYVSRNETDFASLISSTQKKASSSRRLERMRLHEDQSSHTHTLPEDQSLPRWAILRLLSLDVRVQGRTSRRHRARPRRFSLRRVRLRRRPGLRRFGRGFLDRLLKPSGASGVSAWKVAFVVGSSGFVSASPRWRGSFQRSFSCARCLF